MISKPWIILVALFPYLGTAQTVTTFDSRTNGAAIVSNYPSRDIGVIDNLDTFGWMRSWSAPAMIETDLRIGVTITGTIAQAEAGLSRAVSNAVPAIAHYRGKDQRGEARKDRAAKQANPNSAAKQSDILEATRQIEAILDRLQMLEQRD